MIREPLPDEAALRDVDARRILLEQDEVLVLVASLLVLEKLDVTQVAAERVDLRDQEVGLHADPLALRQRRLACFHCCAGAVGLALLPAGGDRRLDRWGWSLPERLADWRCGRRLRLLSIPYPGIDQQEHRDRKHQTYEKPVTIH